ncbi:MAG: hypothetical protein ABIE23_00545 [archaeon]
MISFEFLQAIMNFDVGWVINIIMSNILWTFIFFMICWYFFPGWKSIKFFIIFSVTVWFILDFYNSIDIAILAGGFLFIYYISKMIIFAFAEQVEGLKDKLPLLSEIQFVIMIIAFNFFMMG